jgi:chromosome segregation protein
VLTAWRAQREAPLALVVLEGLGEPAPRGPLPEGATRWADELVSCPPRFATLARVLLGDVAVVEDARTPAPGAAALATAAGVRLASPGLVWWPGRIPASAKATGTELAMLLAAAVRELGGIEARIVELEADLAEARRFESAARIEHARIEQRLSGRQGERQRLEETAGETGTLADRLRGEVDALAADRSRMETELREREAERESERKRQDELTGRFYARQDALHADRQKVTALEDELEALRKTAEVRQEEVLAAESRLNDARTRFELAKHDFTAEFADRAEQADSLAAQPLSDEETAQLAKLESRLAELGEAVNLLALEEFKDVGERHAEYTGQVEDLRKSRESLQRAIYRLDKTAQRRFEETFETIKAHFHQMFRRLFGGGEADLRLVENEEGERGVEIEAKPPGKRTQSIALLSGGERALTSTALLFALYRTKPSPFCFLDELDAPLDDANTDRFMKILKEFNDQTQFILITHNKHSMELTDSLYGITMEEDGVSKVVSAKLRGQAQPVPASA